MYIGSYLVTNIGSGSGPRIETIYRDYDAGFGITIFDTVTIAPFLTGWQMDCAGTEPKIL